MAAPDLPETRDFGSTVELKREIDIKRARAKLVSVCGIRTAGVKAAATFEVDPGDTILLVETPSGESFEVPAKHVRTTTDKAD